jgi:hypothetical protein
MGIKKSWLVDHGAPGFIPPARLADKASFSILVYFAIYI